MGSTPDVQVAKVSPKPEFRELSKRTAAVGEFQATTLTWIVRFTIGALKLMRDDAQIGLGLALIKAPIYSAINRVRFECESPVIQNFVEAEFQRLWRGAVRSSLTGVEFGFAAHEKIWSQDADGIHLDQIKDLDPGWCVALHDEDGDFAGIRWTPQPSFAIGTAFIQPVTIPAEKAFWFTHNKEFGNPYGWSRMHKAADFYQWGRNCVLLAGHYAQRCAIPRMVSHCPAELRVNVDGATVDTLSEMQRNLEALRAGGSVVLPDERDEKGSPRWDVALLDDKLAGLEALMKLIEYCDTMKFRGMIVPDAVATQRNKGAYNIAEAHQEVFMTLEEQLLFDLLDFFERYLVPQMVLYNFGPTAPKCSLTSDGLSEENKQRLQSLIDALIQQPVTAQVLAQAMDEVKILQDGDIPVKASAEEAYETGAEPEPAAAEIPAPDPNAPDLAMKPAGAGSTGAPGNAGKLPLRDGVHVALRRGGSETRPYKTRPYQARPNNANAQIRDERDAVIERGVAAAERHFDSLIEGVKKN